MFRTIFISVLLVLAVFGSFLYAKKNMNSKHNGIKTVEIPEKTEQKLINGINICIKEAGIQNAPVIIFLHGKGYFKEGMDALFNYYKKKYHVVSYDLRGHGKSDKPQQYVLDDHVEDLHDLISSFGFNKPIIVGFSMGSYITLLNAEKYPEPFSKMVLIGTRAFRVTSAEDADKEKDIASVSIQNFNLMENIDKVTVPAIVISGENDNINPPEEAKKVADALSAEFYIIPGEGHVCFLNNPQATFDIIDKFLEKK